MEQAVLIIIGIIVLIAIVVSSNVSKNKKAEQQKQTQFQNELAERELLSQKNLASQRAELERQADIRRAEELRTRHDEAVKAQQATWEQENKACQLIEKKQKHDEERQAELAIKKQEEERQALFIAGQKKQYDFCESGTEYANIISELYYGIGAKFSMQNIRSISVSMVNKMSENEKNRLHAELQQGIIIIVTEPHLYKYMHAYGNMHEAKLHEAFSSLFSDNQLQAVGQKFEIIDYGCGQGLGAICLIDYLKNTDYQCAVSKVTLIEPSELALKRAALNVRYSLRSYVQAENVLAIHKKLDDLIREDLITQKDITKIHIFSNVIDVNDFDIQQLYQKITSTQQGLNYFVCVSPNIYADGSNFRNQRLRTFLALFGVKAISHKLDDIGKWKRHEIVFKAILEHQLIPASTSVNFPKTTGIEENNDLPF